MIKLLWVFTAVSGFIAILMGAAAAHWLEATLDMTDIARIEKAATYQIYHTLALLALVIGAEARPTGRVRWPALLFMLGIILFSGSLYLYSFTHLRFLVYITPLGGVSFMAGWLALLCLLRK